MSDDELRDLARALRETAGRELRADAAEVEQLTEMQRRRRAHLSEVVRAVMHRGDDVAVTVIGRTLRGRLVAVGKDYVVMESDDAVADVRLNCAVITTHPRARGGTTGIPASPTLQARLAELEHDGATIELVTTGGDVIAGTVSVAARDHIVIATEAASTIVPVEVVAAVLSRFGPRRR